MVNDKNLNLVNVYGKLEQYKNSIFRRIKEFLRMTPSLTSEDKNDLGLIQDRIRLIEHNQQAYFLHHHTQSSEKKMTQKDLTQQGIETQLSTLKYTYEQVQQLRKDITTPTGIYAHLYKKHPTLFSQIVPILQSMLNYLKKGRTKEPCLHFMPSRPEDDLVKTNDLYLYQEKEDILYATKTAGGVQREKIKPEEYKHHASLLDLLKKSSPNEEQVSGAAKAELLEIACIKNPESPPFSLTPQEEFFFSERLSIYKIASHLGGYYCVSSQSVDPLNGVDHKGNCFGHVMTWMQQIQNTGRYTGVMRADQQTRALQLGQNFGQKFLSLFRTQGFWDWHHESMLKITDEILQKMKPTTIYGLSFKSHIVGLRRLPGTDQIEVNDPNYGIFILPNAFAFKVWLFQLLSAYKYRFPFEGMLLEELGQQPGKVSASIPAPELADEKADEGEWKAHFVTPTALTGFYHTPIRQAVILATQKGPELDFDLVRQLDRNREKCKCLLKEKLNFSQEIVLEETDYKREQGRLLAKVLSLINNAELCESELSEIQQECLEKLRKQISKAPLCMPLDLLLTYFFAEKMEESEQTYKDIFDTIPRSGNLLQQFFTHEISPFCLIVLQEGLLLNLADLVKRYPDSQPHTDISSAIEKYATGEKSLKATLETIQSASQQENYRLFSSCQAPHSILNDVNLDDPRSLEAAQMKISALIKNTPAPKNEEAKESPSPAKK